MDGLITHEKLERKLPTMILAFAGWPDAGEAATQAVRHLVESLPAKKFAAIDPEQFYDFTVVRPQTRLNESGHRIITWPANDFYYFASQENSGGFLLYIGTEPNLKWRTFSSIILSVAEESGVELVISLGALLDAVPHTREPRVTGRASSPELMQKAEWLGIRNSGYQGPTGIHSSFMEACDRNGLPYASIWAHSPHYVNTSPNPKVSHALLQRLCTLVDIEVELEEMHKAGETFEAEVTKLISKQPEMKTYVQRLEQRYDAAHAPSGEIPSPDAMVQELEEFLRSQGQSSNGPEES